MTGQTVSLEYTSEAGLTRERRTMDDVVVLEEMGQMKRLEPPYEDTDDLELVLDPDGDVWARETGKPSTDRLFGSNGVVVEA